MPRIKANGIELHYIVVGDGPDVVMIHGFLGNLALWHLYSVPVLRREFRLITYDMRGHGFSEVTPAGYTAGDMAEDLRGLLDVLGIQRAAIVGHSFGADVALYFALRYPERVSCLAALEPGLAALVHQRKEKDWVGWSYWVSALEAAGIQVPEDKLTDIDYLLQVSLETPKFYGPARGLPRNRGPLINLIKNTTLVKDYEHIGDLTLDALATIETRTLLVYGRKSQFLSSYDYIHKALPNCKSILLPGGEHFGPLEQPELITQDLLEFLRGEVQPPAANEGGLARSAAQS